MPAATTRAGLIAITGKEYARLDRLLDGLDEAGLQEVAHDTSVRDVIADRAHWIGPFPGWHGDGMAGRAVELPAPGYRRNELTRDNAMPSEHDAGLA